MRRADQRVLRRVRRASPVADELTLEEVDSIVESARATSGEDWVELVEDFETVVAGAVGRWTLWDCHDGHAWLLRQDTDVWFRDGVPVGRLGVGCARCARLESEVAAVAALRPTFRAGGVTWSLFGSGRAPEYVSDLGRVRRPHPEDRRTPGRPWEVDVGGVRCGASFTYLEDAVAFVVTGCPTCGNRVR